ncbi:hypothetical protein JCM11641_000026 [Rhodosporidiobolus odoratus]
MSSTGEDFLPPEYRDVEMLGAPGWLAVDIAGPYTFGYSALLILTGSFLQQFLSFVSSGEYSRLPRSVSKMVLGVLAGLELAYAGLIFVEQWGLSVRQKRTVEGLIELDPAWNALPLIAGWIAALTQCFLTYRASSVWLPILFANCSAIQAEHHPFVQFIPGKKWKVAFWGWMGFLVLIGLFGSTLWNVYGGLATLPIGWNNAVCIWLVASAAADISISVALAWSLRRRIVGFNQTTDGLLRKLVWLALRTAAYTAVLSLVGAVIAACYRDGDYATTNLNLAFWLPMPAIYGISLFTTVSSSRRAINTTIGGTGNTNNPPTREMLALPSASAFAGGNDSDTRPSSARPPLKQRLSHSLQQGFGGIVASVPIPSPAHERSDPFRRPRSKRNKSASSRNSLGQISVVVTRQVEQTVEDGAWDEMSAGSRKGHGGGLQKGWKVRDGSTNDRHAGQDLV